MPDIKNIIDNLSGLSIPGIEELKAFTAEIKKSELMSTQKAIIDGINRIGEVIQHQRGYRF